jgi:hypothetical protein
MGEDSSVDEESADATGRRRLLIKAAVGAGVAVAAHSVPKVSVVPAYAATASTAGSGGSGVYGIAYDQNMEVSNGGAPFGWLPFNDAAYQFLTTSDKDPDVTFSGASSGIQGPTSGSVTSEGYTYTYPGGLTATARLCVGFGAYILFSNVPSGMRVAFLSDGRALKKDQDNTTLDGVAAGDNNAEGTGTLGLSIDQTYYYGKTNLQAADDFWLYQVGSGACQNQGYSVIRWTFQLVTI